MIIICFSLHFMYCRILFYEMYTMIGDMIISIFSVPDEGYSRNVLGVLNLISTFLLRTVTNVPVQVLVKMNH